MKKIYILVLTLTLVIGCTSVSFAADVFSKGAELLNDAQSFIILISTPAALIGVGVGAFLKKFSFGDPQKIKQGSTVITASLVGWCVINGLPLILATLQKYIA